MDNEVAYKKERNYFLNLFKKQKKIFYSTKNKHFWKVINPSFSEIMSSNQNISWLEIDINNI